MVKIEYKTNAFKIGNSHAVIVPAHFIKSELIDLTKPLIVNLRGEQ